MIRRLGAGLVAALVTFGPPGVGPSLAAPATGLLGTAKDDAYDAYEDHQLSVSAPGVLGNDAGGGSEPCVLSVDDSNLDGDVTVDEDGSFVFTPLDDYVAATTFDYDMGVLTEGTCGGTPSTATVEIDVQSVNDPPTAALDDDCSGGVTVNEDSSAYSSADHCTVIHSFGTVEEAGQVVEAWVVSNNNTALFAVQPSISVSGSVYGDLHFTPAANAHGSATVSVRGRDSGGTANDGVDLSPTITFTLTIASVNDLPVARADAFVALKDSTLNIGAPGVLSNDSDQEGATLTAVLSTTTTHGILTLAANGSFSYTPTLGYTGPDAFSYRAFDGIDLSAPQVVSMTVTAVPPINTPPLPTVPPPTGPGETLTPILTPSPGESLDPGATPTEFVPPTPQTSGQPSAGAGVSSLAPGETPQPDETSGSGLGSPLTILLGIVLLVLIGGVAVAMWGPGWLARRRGEG
jgi:VCBS repeat-containing protein